MNENPKIANETFKDRLLTRLQQAPLLHPCSQTTIKV